MIWPNHAIKGLHPDIFLSLGTGLYMAKNEYSAVGKNWIDPFASIREYVKMNFSFLRGPLKEKLNCEAAWRRFVDDECREDLPECGERYIRLNPSFASSLPKLNSYKEIDNIIQLTNEYCKDQNLEAVVHRLFASLFYFKFNRLEYADGDLQNQTHTVLGT